MAIKLWQVAVVLGLATGLVLSRLSLAVGLVFVLFVPATILVAARDVERARADRS
jgi:uncharacterized membrane protein